MLRNKTSHAMIQRIKEATLQQQIQVQHVFSAEWRVLCHFSFLQHMHIIAL